MSLNKKVVWLPYDMDTAIGSDNQGALIFNYNLEDTDMIGTEGVFNGSTNVMWNNMRDAFPNEIQTMYQNLRSSGALSYDLVKQMFENHQNKWPEAIFNEDAIYKYIQPLINDNDGQYLSMALGSKAEQRKWWLYNRFKYIDSKYSGGESLTDVITLRPGALDSGITITPYADIYVAVRWDNDTAKTRATRGVPTTIPCPYSTVGNNVVNILNASQLSSVGDLSGFKCRSANFVKASRLQYIKVGDSADGYDNPNLLELLVGNNTLLTTVDARNCSSLTATINLSGASNIEEVYFDGTKIAGVSLPNGGVLNTLHLPDSVTNLTVQNQPNITDFVFDDASNLSTLRLENCGKLMDNAKDFIFEIKSGSRVRLIGINWEVSTTQELSNLYDLFDTMTGLDEHNENMPKAQISGVINVEYYVGNPATMQARYPNITITYNELETYTVTFKADDKTTILYEATNIIYGTAATYNGIIPTKIDDTQHLFNFAGWTPSIDSIIENMVVYPLFTFNGSVARQILSRTEGMDEITYTGTKKCRSYALAKYSNIKILNITNCTQLGDSSLINSFADCTNLETLNAPELTAIDTPYCFVRCTKLKTLNLPKLQAFWGDFSFQGTAVEEIDFPNVTGLGASMFAGCSELVSVNLPKVTLIFSNCFRTCVKLTNVNLQSLPNFNRPNIFEGCTSLKEISFPSLTSWDNSATSVFKSCTALEIVDLAYVSNNSIRQSIFDGCTSLIAVILRTDKVYPLDNINAFTRTKYASDGAGGAYIYVPNTWIASYQTANNWSTLYASHPDMFRALEDYTVDGTVDGELDKTKI